MVLECWAALQFDLVGLQRKLKGPANCRALCRSTVSLGERVGPSAGQIFHEKCFRTLVIIEFVQVVLEDSRRASIVKKRVRFTHGHPASRFAERRPRSIEGLVHTKWKPLKNDGFRIFPTAVDLTHTSAQSCVLCITIAQIARGALL